MKDELQIKKSSLKWNIMNLKEEIEELEDKIQSLQEKVDKKENLLKMVNLMLNKGFKYGS